MKIISLLVLLNFLFLGIKIFGGDIWVFEKLFANEKSYIYEINKDILAQEAYNELLKEYDKKYFNFSRIKNEEKWNLENCEIPKKIPENNYPQYSVLLRYQDYFNDKYTKAIECNIARSLYQDITIVVDYKEITDPNFNKEILSQYRKLGYKFHWVIRLSIEDMKDLQNIMTLIYKPASLSFHIEKDATNEALKTILDFYIYYYEDLEVYVGWNGKEVTRLPYTVRYIESPTFLGNLDIPVIKQQIIQNYTIESAISYFDRPESFQLETLVQENPNIKISVPNGAFLFRDIAEDIYVNSLDKEYEKLDIIDREYVKLKYRAYFLTK